MVRPRSTRSYLHAIQHMANTSISTTLRPPNDQQLPPIQNLRLYPLPYTPTPRRAHTMLHKGPFINTVCLPSIRTLTPATRRANIPLYLALPPPTLNLNFKLRILLSGTTFLRRFASIDHLPAHYKPGPSLLSLILRQTNIIPDITTRPWNRPVLRPPGCHPRAHSLHKRSPQIRPCCPRSMQVTATMRQALIATIHCEHGLPSCLW